jgi:hypothetical protein
MRSYQYTLMSRETLHFRIRIETYLTEEHLDKFAYRIFANEDFPLLENC